ncbi:MAG: response regulator [Candidatus Sulfobium sp.]|jgi:DNA-binding response OmpR family regulator
MAHKLLLADDSITIQKVVELVLAEEDFEIKSANNGEDALKAVETFGPDIVLADVDMPQMNGYQLCEKIKQDPATSRIPVILLAGAFEPIDDELAEKVGADDSIIKPFESQELISKLNAVLTLASAEGAEEAIFAEAGEAVEVTEETGAEAVELTGAEEDLWAMEDIPEDTAELAEEALTAEEQEQTGVEDAFEMPEEEPEAAAIHAFEAPPPAGVPAGVEVPEVAMPSREELLALIEKAVDRKVDTLLSGVDIREVLLSSLTPIVKESVEKILWETAPELGDKVMKEVLKESVSSLGKEVEKVIWETVPDLAGTMISKEIEKIRSEY